MGILDTYKTETKKDQENARNKGAAEGLTLQKIMASEKYNGLFGKMLAKDGTAPALEAFARLTEGAISQTDISRLEEFRAEFNQRMEKVKFLKENITVEIVQKFASRSDGFQEIINLVGPQKAVAIINKRLELMAVDDYDRFDGINYAMATLVSHETNYTALNEKVTNMTAEYGVNDATYIAALKSSDRERAMKSLRKDIRARLSGWEKIKDSVGSWFSSQTSSRSRAEELMGKKSEIERAIDQVNSNIENVGGVLSDSVNESDDVRSALNAEILSTPTEEPKLPTLGEAKEENSLPRTVEDLGTLWYEYMKQDGFDHLNPDEQEEEYDRFVKNQKKAFEANNPKTGFWSSVMATIFESMAKSEKKNFFPVPKQNFQSESNLKIAA